MPRSLPAASGLLLCLVAGAGRNRVLCPLVCRGRAGDAPGARLRPSSCCACEAPGAGRPLLTSGCSLRTQFDGLPPEEEVLDGDRSLEKELAIDSIAGERMELIAPVSSPSLDFNDNMDIPTELSDSSDTHDEGGHLETLPGPFRSVLKAKKRSLCGD